MTTSPEFSRLLTEHLLQSDRSAAWLAHRLQVHPATVGRWLNEATRPATPEMVIRVADLLGVHAAGERRALLAAAGFAYQEGLEQNAPAQATAPAPQPPRLKAPHVAASFIGRQQEIAQLVERLADPAAPLVTIIGLGGMGKSRLAIEAAARTLELHAAQFAGGVCFVPLAAVTNATLMPSAIAAALEIPTQGALDLEALLVHYLSDKRLFLILDNLEQLLDGLSLIERLLASAPGLKVLATSRTRLRLDTEWLFPLDGLTVPPANDASLQSAGEATAITLFVERARRLQPAFVLSAATAPEIGRICRLVGGMPLAIELAAAWLRVLPLAEIAAEIEASLDFLAASLPTPAHATQMRQQNDAKRHRSMRAVFDHSWRLLSADERQALLRISLFRGGFTRQAAQAVAGAQLHTLAELVDSSWIQLNAQGRYEIHELARQYAEEKLEEEPAMAAVARAAHCAYFAAFAEHIGDVDGWVYEHGLKALVVELDNIWAGWRWAAANRNFDQNEKYVTALIWLTSTYGLYDEVVGEFEKLCALARTTLADRSVPAASQRSITLKLARLLYELCTLYWRAISVEQGRRRGEESIELLRGAALDVENGEPSHFYLKALGAMSIVTALDADYRQAKLYAEEMLHLIDGKQGYTRFYCDALNYLGHATSLEGNYAETNLYLIACLEALVHSPDDGIYVSATNRLAHICNDTGEWSRAAQLAASTLVVSEKSGNRMGVASALLVKADVATTQALFEEGERCLARAYTLIEEMGNRHDHVRFLICKARLARRMGQVIQAQQCYQQAYEIAQRMAHRKYAALAQTGVGFTLLDQGKDEEARVWLLAALQQAWPRHIMPEVIWAVVGLAALQGAAGQPQCAAQWLRLAQSHPACPKRVHIDSEQIRCRLGLAEMAPADQSPEELDAALAAVVLEVLG